MRLSFIVVIRAACMPLLAFVLLGASAPSASAYTPLPPARIVDELNAFRVEHGFPGAVVEQPKLTAGCRRHNQWMQRNATMQHPEIPGSPLSSAAGHQAGTRSILASGSTWANGNPWLNAPVHLADMLMPGMTETGASEAFRHNCLTTHTPPNLFPAQPPTDTSWGYPMEGGSMPHRQTALERPAPPQTYGVKPIPDGVPTGPNLIVFYQGPRMLISFPQLTRASLRGPDGAEVPVMTVNQHQLALLPPGAGVIVPRHPLKPYATYTWTATFTAPAFTYTTDTRSFTTTDRKLCGEGIGGWYRPQSCPVRILSVQAPKQLSVDDLRLPVPVVVTVDERARLAAQVNLGTERLALAQGRASRPASTTLLLRFSRVARRQVIAKLRTSTSVSVSIDVWVPGGALKRIALTIAR